MTRTYTRLPIGAIGDSAPTTPPRYVPGRRTPLDCRPLSDVSEYDTLPMPRVIYRRPQRHSRIYWLAWDARWWVADAWDTMRHDTGWVGQTVMLVLCAAVMLAAAAALLVSLLLAGVR